MISEKSFMSRWFGKIVASPDIEPGTIMFIPECTLEIYDDKEHELFGERLVFDKPIGTLKGINEINAGTAELITIIDGIEDDEGHDQ